MHNRELFDRMRDNFHTIAKVLMRIQVGSLLCIIAWSKVSGQSMPLIDEYNIYFVTSTLLIGMCNRKASIEYTPKTYRYKAGRVRARVSKNRFIIENVEGGYFIVKDREFRDWVRVGNVVAMYLYPKCSVIAQCKLIYAGDTEELFKRDKMLIKISKGNGV